MTSYRSIVLGITGGIACGKSEVGRILSNTGFDVLDTDFVAHEQMRAGSVLFDQLVERFGKSIIGSDGQIDRPRFGKLVFSDSSALNALNKLVHPAVIRATEEWVAARRAVDRNVAVLVPLLFEVGWIQGWDRVVCVVAEEKTVFRRMKKRGLSAAEVQGRIAAQMQLADKKDRADFCIENNGSLEALRNNVSKVLECIQNERKK